ncbi:MAG: AAA family ATPase, partial [Candidatus Dormibacteraeota bacterium]|nr:AAA family ATPase [Candidatus Dormibacteraeota bacterium]
CGATFTTSPATTAGQGESAAARTSQRTVERRHVSVLFADLVGFTSLSASRDSEDVRDLLSRYFSGARSIIERYGGTVEKFIGDAVMAVWGVPAAQEDDAERAVRAALELVDAVRAFGDEAGAPDLQARAGVLTGEAAVNLGVVGEGMVAGDLVNTASRIQAAADPGTVYVGDATRRATEAAIEYADTGEHQLKGKPDPERLWQARRVVAGRRGSMRPTVLEPPFSGRDRELRLLKEYLHATSEERRARLLSIVGVAGVGKSRIAWEFEKYVDGLTEAVLWHRGRCLSYGEGVTYWALAEMVRMRAGIVENQRPDEARQKLRATVDEYLKEEEERRWVEPRLAQLLGLEDRSTSDPRDLFAAWRFFFERLATRNLTVLVFEDMQWADAGLFDFIEYLLEWSRTSAILVITLARPDVAERRPGWGIGKRGLTSLYLEPLSPDAMASLLTGMVPGLPAELRERILDRAAGIPLYAVETVRMLLDRGLIADQDGTFVVRGSLESLEVPESLHAMIAARLDSLPAEERRLVQDAAVLGKAFTPTALAAVSAEPQADVERLLERLVAKDLFAIESDPRSPERGQYAFVQDLVRNVAEGMLSRRERKQRHLAAAEYLTSSWSEEEEIAEVVATHLVEAFEADPGAADAAEIRTRARDALVRAGEHAAALGSGAQALRYFERAIAFGGDDESIAVLHERAGDVASTVALIDATREHFETALATHRTRGDVLAEARVTALLGVVDLRTGHFDRAKTAVQRAIAVLSETPGDDAERDAVLVRASNALAVSLYYTGDVDGALAFVERALTLAERRDLIDQLLQALDTKSWVLHALQRTRESLILQEGALKLAIDTGHTRETVRIGVNLAEALEEDDQLEASIERSEQAEATCVRAGDVVAHNAVYAYLERLSPLLELGRWDDCERLWSRFADEDAE